MVANSAPQEKWYSMEGYLSMKQLSTALSFLTSRKRLYFGLDESQNALIYYKDKADFDKNKDCQGTISLDGAICVPTANICIFVLHTSSKKFEIEADNFKCAECWLHALQQRKDLNDNHKTELSKIIQDSMKRYRSRSRSMPSDTEMPKKTMARPKYPPTRRKTFKLDSLQPLPIDHSINQSAPATPLKSTPQFFPSHKSRLSRCISLKVGNKPLNVNGKPRVVVDKSKRRASLQESPINRPLIEEVNQNPRHSLATPPTWLDEWVTKWLDEQLIWADHHKKQSERNAKNGKIDEDLTDKSTDEKQDSHCSPAETMSNNGLNSSATTSQCETDDRSSIHSSQPEIYEELLMLRQINNEQKARIHTLSMELEQAKINTKVMDESALQDQNKVLNSEVVRMSEQCLGLDKQLQQFTKKCDGLENEIDAFKKEYIFLLQSSVHIPLNSNYDTIQVKLFGGDVHEKRIKKLLAQAREMDPKLPTFESVTKPGNFHIDDYGFRHSFTDISHALHYISTQLNSHYNTQSDEYARLKARWRLILETSPNKIENNKTNRELCRRGIPRSLRSKVWRVLINQQVSDLKKKYGEYYYRNLCSSQGTPNEKLYCSTHQKQINLDLLRTMPSNVHFMSASCKGVNHLQAVLRAFCLHDPIIGYCQGMNFLTATALLFVSPEDAFWFLIAITERFFDRSYFDQNLSGAQADQEVLKELVETKLPKLSKHLEECSIDLATACLNWFLALFFDAIPFESMLRIWDCFLLEGPKVLFRFSIALLSLYEDEILERSDTISVMKVLKAAVRLTYDSNGLMKYSFDHLQPFPSRIALQQKQRAYLEVLQEKLNQRMRLRKILEVATISQEASEKVCDLPIEDIVWNEFKTNVGYVCAGNQKRGKLAMITIHADATNLNALDLEFDCRPVSMVVPKKDMAFLSLLSNYIVAVQLNNDSAHILWEIKLPDVGLKLLHNEERLLCALANGTLTVLEKAFVNNPTALDLYNIPIAAAPITDALMDNEYLYLAVACKVVILDRQTLSPLSSLYVASSACGSHVPMFEKIRSFSNSIYGLWLITAHSSLIQLWLDSECQLLFDITFDHSHSSRRASIDDPDNGDLAEVYSILFHDDEVWIGTVDGYLMLYSVIQVEDSVFDRKSSLMGSRTRSDMAAYALHRYPPGKRLSPIQTHNQHSDQGHVRQSMYYIPTAKERLLEEITSAKEYPEDTRQTRKISVIIDQSTKQYKVNVEAVRQYSQESSSTVNNSVTDRKRHSSTTTCGDNSEGSTKGQVQSLRARRQQRQLQLHKGQSIDSAVSMGDSLNGQRQSPACETILESLPIIVSPRAETDPEQHVKANNKIPLKRRTQSDSTHTHLVDVSSPSMEYDDSFELYAESEDQVPDIGLLEDTLQNSPTVKSVQIPVRKMSSNVFGKSKALTIDESDASSMTSCQSPNIRLRSDSAASESSIEMAIRNKRPSLTPSVSRVNSQKRPMRPKLRRKDLEIEENATCLIAVKESAPQLEMPTPSPSSSSDHSKDGFEQKKTHLSVEHGRWIDYTSRKPSLITNGVEEQLEEKAVNSSLSLSLQMKLKVSDKPLKCIALTTFEGEPVVVTGAGNYGDEEALLRWRRDKSSGLWINDPLVDSSVVGRKRTVLSANGSVKRRK